VPFLDEWRDFLRFVRKPQLTPRLPGDRLGSGCRADWCAGLALGRLLQWVLLLWGLNLLFLGPLAFMAAQLGSAQHRLLHAGSIPWVQVLLWAPVVEELLFRYGLRRIGQAACLAPVMLCVLLLGMQWFSGVLLLIGLWVMVVQAQRGDAALSWRWRRCYQRQFGWVFYASTTLFALMHLYNFKLQQTPVWLWPLLVLPQWCTGLVLGWLRVRHGIGASILLHALFNGGPLLLVWLLLGTP